MAAPHAAAAEAARLAFAASLAFLALAINDAPAVESASAFAARSISQARTSAKRQRVQRAERMTGWGACPLRTSSCQVESEMPPAAAQVGPSISATSASAGGTGGRLIFAVTVEAHVGWHMGRHRSANER